MISGKNIFHVFPLYAYVKHVTPGAGSFLAPGLKLIKPGRSSLGDTSYQISML